MSNELLKEELSITISRADIEVETADSLQKAFAPFYEKTQSWLDKAKELVVTDASQTEAIEQAHQARLALKGIRGDVEKVHKVLKADSLKKGQLLDLIKRTLIQRIEPIEEHLQTQEDFVKIAEKNRLDAIENARVAELSQYVENVTYYQLRDMPEEQYKQLLAGCIQGKKEREAVAQKAEEDRLAEIEKEKAEQERIRLENEQLRKEAEEKEKAATAERLKIQARNKELLPYVIVIRDYNKMLEMPEDEYQKELIDVKKTAQLHAESERKKFDEENKKKEAQEAENKRLQAELKERQDKEAAAERERIKAEKEQKAANRKAARASDMDKMLTIQESIILLQSRIELLAWKSAEMEDTAAVIVKTLTMINDLITKLTE